MDAAAPDSGKTGLPAAEEAVFNKNVLPKARAKLKSEGCEETIEVAGRVALGGERVDAGASVATGAAVETGYSNRSGSALVTGQSVFGSFGTASAAVAP